MELSTAREHVADGLSGLAVGTIVDDRKLRVSLIQALDRGGIELFASAVTADALAARAADLDAVVLHEPGDAGAMLDRVRAAREALPETILIVVWPEADSWNARRALRAGADGLVNEAELEATLSTTIRAVVSGLVCVPRHMRAPLESESLSMREKQVLGMLVRGFTNAEIADRLFLAESTVKSHLSSAYTKLGVRTRKDAATMILDPAEGLGPGILAISAA